MTECIDESSKDDGLEVVCFWCGYIVVYQCPVQVHVGQNKQDSVHCGCEDHASIIENMDIVTSSLYYCKEFNQEFFRYMS